MFRRRLSRGLTRARTLFYTIMVTWGGEKIDLRFCFDVYVIGLHLLLAQNEEI